MNDHIGMRLVTSASENLKILQSMSQSLAEMSSWGLKDATTLLLSLVAIGAPLLTNYLNSRREQRRELVTQVQNLRRANSVAQAFSIRLNNALFYLEHMHLPSKAVAKYVLRELDRHLATAMNTVDISLSSMYHDHPTLNDIRFSLEQQVIDIQFDLILWAEDKDDIHEVNSTHNLGLFKNALDVFEQEIQSIITDKCKALKRHALRT
ncbi:hypothetical protein [Shewanella algae]|uniref:hypothetical protein n=1 Tax=Shewanella algae TaxID=38313 RepID=UPI000BB5AA25|nr:hypothetical protein [Shewanella algae]PBQ26359.1 hypothetical protein AYI97_14700 [Shewanella algae]QNH99485.1 hypothetical protein HU689_13385 [Shewanella algae]